MTDTEKLKRLAAGNRLVLEVRLAEDSKTDGQRKYYHGVVLKEIAKQATQPAHHPV